MFYKELTCIRPRQRLATPVPSTIITTNNSIPDEVRLLRLPDEVLAKPGCSADRLLRLPSEARRSPVAPLTRLLH